MSYKTDKLTHLFPDAYAAKDHESVLYKLLDAIGVELVAAEQAIKHLLKSHWVDYASDKALDGLGAIYGVSRRRLRDGTLETDEAFRQRLKSIVPLFTGGGTRQAVIGAVRSALGLPFDLDQLRLQSGFKALQEDIEKLIYLKEFSRKGERIIDKAVNEVDGASEIKLQINTQTTREAPLKIQWKFNTGGGRLLSLERLLNQEGAEAVGVKSMEALIIPPGKTLTLSAGEDGRLSAVLDLEDVTNRFTTLTDTTPAVLPEVPIGQSEWRFRAQSGLFGVSAFGADTFDVPVFEVEMNWLRFEPLTFEVHVPYFLQQAVAALKELHDYQGRLFVFEGLPLESIVKVVDQTRAAGVKGSVQFSLNFLDHHDQDERKFLLQGERRIVEEAGAAEYLSVSSLNDIHEHHDTNEKLMLGAVFDVSPFDQGHGFID